MKEKYPYWVNKEGRPMTGKYHWFGSFKVYLAYRQLIAEELSKFDFEQSFTGQFLKAGFETYGIGLSPSRGKMFLYKKQISPTINWFGTSVYEPDTYFVKGDRRLLMSLNGVETPHNERYIDLLKTCSCKYIKMEIGDKTIYEDWTGNLPSKEIVKEFLNA